MAKKDKNNDQQQCTKQGKISKKTACYRYDKKDGYKKMSKTIKKGKEVSIDMRDKKNKKYRIQDTDDNNAQVWVPMGNVEVLDDLNARDKKAHSDIIGKIAKSASNNYSYINPEELLVTNLTGIMGAPYQFMTTCDNPVSNNIAFGRKYIERIVERMPLLLISPGEPDFMPTYSKKEKKNILNALAKAHMTGGGLNKSDYEAFLDGKSGRYYTFDFKWAPYYRYVNPMLRYCAIMLGIGKIKHTTMTDPSAMSLKNMVMNTYANGGRRSTSVKGYTARLDSYKWEKTLNSKFKKATTLSKAIAFYLDSETSISESISTSTTQSQLADTINGFSQTAREFRFLAGPIFGANMKAVDESGFNKMKQKAINSARSFLGPRSAKFFNNLEEMFQAIGQQGRLLFPEIWEDTEFSRSYDVSFKLRTPDCDKVSWYLNICVPLIHLLALAAPRSLSPNAYKSPFLVRAYYKGIFNVDMGIITSMSITKGKDGAWTLDGLPTEVDVTMTIKDLYQMMAISDIGKKNITDKFTDMVKGKSVKQFVRNTSMIDYLSSMCGVNINKPEINRIFEVYRIFRLNQLKDLPSDVWTGITDGAENILGGIYDRILGKS